VLGYMVGHLARTTPPLRTARLIAPLPAAAPRLRAGAVAVCEVADLLAQPFTIGAATRRELIAIHERWDGRGFRAGCAGRRSRATPVSYCDDLEFARQVGLALEPAAR